MSLSGLPDGYLSLTQALNSISFAIASSVGHNHSELKKILDPDAVEKSPPKAMSEAAFKVLFKPICQSKLNVLTMHPNSGDILQVPLAVFVSSVNPRCLFSSPSPHCDPGMPTGFEEYGRQLLFVRNDNHTKNILEEATRSILAKRAWPKKERSEEPDSNGRLWVKEAPKLVNWPIDFALVIMGHDGRISEAIEEYGSWIDYGDSRYPSERAFSKYARQAGKIEAWARSGALGITGVRVLRQGQRERPAGLSALDWMDLEIRHDMYGDRGLYASPPRPVPLAEWWERLFVEREQLLKALAPEPAQSNRLGRPPKRQELARNVATTLWGLAEWPSDRTQGAALADINEWLEDETKRRQSEGGQSATLQKLSLGTLRAAFGKSKKSS